MNRQLTIIIYVCVFILMVFLSFIFSSADMSYGSCSLTKLEAIYRKDESKKKKSPVKILPDAPNILPR